MVSTAGITDAVKLSGQRHATFKLSESFRPPQVQSAWAEQAELRFHSRWAATILGILPFAPQRHQPRPVVGL